MFEPIPYLCIRYRVQKYTFSRQHKNVCVTEIHTLQNNFSCQSAEVCIKYGADTCVLQVGFLIVWSSLSEYATDLFLVS